MRRVNELAKKLGKMGRETWCERSEVAETERLIISDTAQNISLMSESVT